MSPDSCQSVDIVRFTDEYTIAADVYQTPADELRRRDRSQAQPVRRWLALRNGQAVGAVSAWLRPDDRMFLYFAGSDVGSHAALAIAAAYALGRSVHMFVDAENRQVAEAMRNAGFETEVIEERFRVRFDRALASLGRAWLPIGLSIHRADAADEDRLFSLDNILRRDVPGTTGWRGDRRRFHDELVESPPFDPAAYLVAVDERTGGYVGLVRIWRNPNGPRFGFVAVLPHYRKTLVGPDLTRRALAAAAEWGHDTFITETSVSNTAIYPRMERLGAQSLGRFHQMVRLKR